jgi:hypothetical protein
MHGATAFRYQMRRLVLERRSVCTLGKVPFASLCPVDKAGAGSCTACLRGTKQQRDRLRRAFEFADGEKASSRGLSQARSPQPQPARRADDLIRGSDLLKPPLTLKLAPGSFEFVPVVQRIERRFPNPTGFPSCEGSKSSWNCQKAPNSCLKTTFIWR